MTYQPRWYPQLDGSPKQNDNCGAASGGMLADKIRKGIKPVASKYPWLTRITRQGDGTGWNTPLPTMSSAIRTYCAAHFATNTVDGLYAKWIRTALKAMYGLDTSYAFGAGWDTLAAIVASGRGAIIALNYGTVQGTRYAASAFYGRHWLVVIEKRYNTAADRSEILVFDPLADHRRASIPQGPQWWPAALIKRAFLATSTEIIYPS